VAFVASLLTVREAEAWCRLGTLLAFVIVSAGVLFLRVREPNCHVPSRRRRSGSWRRSARSRARADGRPPWRTWERLIILVRRRHRDLLRLRGAEVEARVESLAGVE